MKKSSRILILLLIMLFIKIDYVGAAKDKKDKGVDAEYIGKGNLPTEGTGKCCKTKNSNYCLYNNEHHATIRVSLIRWRKYKRNGKWVEERSNLGSYFYTSNSYRISKVYTINTNNGTKSADYTETNTNNSQIRYNQKWFANGHNISPSKMENALVSKNDKMTSKAWSIIKNDILKHTSSSAKNWDRFKSKSAFEEYLKDLAEEDAPSGKSDESMADYEKYRLFVEPVVSTWPCNKSSWEYFTAKGYGVYGHTLTNSTRICEIAGLLYTGPSFGKDRNGKTLTKDVGIFGSKAPWGGRGNCSEAGKDYAKRTLKNYNNGVGYNVLKLTKDPVPKKACNYNKNAHFKLNIKGKVAPTSKKGSGPNGENCCNIDDEKVWNAYKKQWKKEHPKDKETISKKAFKLYLLNTLRRTYCFQTITPPPKEDPATCTLNNVSNYSDKTDDFDMTVSSILDRGTSSVTSRQPENSRYRRETITHRGWINCGEEIKLTLPIQYQQEVYRGLKMEWPTYDNEKRSNNYPLELNGKATCNLEIDYEGVKYDNAIWGTCCGLYSCWSCIVGYNWSGIRSDINYIKNRAMDWKKNTSNHYDVNGNFFVKYNDKKYGGIFPIDRYSNGQKSYKYTGFSFGDTGGHFTIEQHSKYKINKNVYRYVLKLTSQMNESVSYRPAGQNYIDVGYGNLPISEDAASGKYNTIIQYNNLGGFSKKFQTSTASYICPYEIGDKIECSCDPGTVNAGMDLIQCMNGACDGKQYTCAEAKEKFCDDNSIKEKYVCPENTRNAGKDITAYVKQYGYDEAVKRYCHDPNKFTVCPNGTTYEGMSITKECYNSENCRRFTCNIYTCPSKSDHPGMVINTAISDRMKIKKCAFQTAYKEIVNTVCYEGADRIIYRVIDLRDPFPGKKGFGRTPGMNWRNENLVKKYITNNRGVANNKVYNKSKAMYHFKLTPSTIKRIRSYNSKNKYSDFKLTCKRKNGRECISDFVHNTSYGLKGGSCYNSGSFNRCR